MTVETIYGIGILLIFALIFIAMELNKITKILENERKWKNENIPDKGFIGNKLPI